MSKPRSRNTLLSSHNKSSHSNSNKDAIESMKYSMDKPDLPIYPLNDETSLERTYPDYMPWKDHTQLNHTQEDQQTNIDNQYSTKGYFEAPQVTNEYYSARNLISATVFVSTDNCNNVLRELSQHLTNSYKIRNEVINKVRADSNHFKIPPRVTLTASKKELWLDDLSKSNVPIRKLAEKIPHGIKNKGLIESICIRNTPINRALWFTKSVLYGEFLASRKKHQSKMLSVELVEKFELHWLQEWTQQVVDYIYKFSNEMPSIVTIEKKDQYMKRINYSIVYLQSLYVECLLDKVFFLTLILRFLKEGLPDVGDSWSNEMININFGQRLVALTLIKVFWNDLLKHDYLLKELSELLLLNHFFINQSLKDETMPEHLLLNILKSISNLIVHLFEFNSSVFIIPGTWSTIGNSLVEILIQDANDKSEEKQEIIQKQLEIINYRNESLILNMNNNSDELVGVRRKADDILKLLDNLNNGKFTEEFAAKFKPVSGKKSSYHWKVNLKLICFWCITPWRYDDQANENILIVCNFLKKNVQLKITSKSLKQEFENEILDIIYQIVEMHQTINLHHNRLYVLMNELYHLNIISIGSYLRKLIASGIFYSSPHEELNLEHLPPNIKLHLEILKNMPIMNNRQSDSILKKWSSTKFNLKEMISTCQTYIQDGILSKIFTNNFDKPLDSDFLNHVTSLNVGLRFFLINWMTNEFKQNLNSSSKVLHFSPIQITNLYTFYSICDNLTVFFKSIVQIILKNDSGIVIYYLDSLYLMARLVMKHFKLVKSIPHGSGNQENSTGFEIFKLIIQNYKDLSFREYDYFNFSPIWNFIDSVIEKKSSGQGESKSMVLDNLVNKNTSETPMQINTAPRTRSRERHEYRYSSTDFRNDLEKLKRSVPRSLTQDEIDEDLRLSTDHDIQQQLNYIFENCFALSEEDEIVLFKVLRSTSVSIDSDNPFVLNEILKEFLLKVNNSSAPFNQKVLFIEKMITYDVLQIEKLVDGNYNNILHHLYFNEKEEIQSTSQCLLLTIAKSIYHDQNVTTLLSVFSNGILYDDLLSNNSYKNKIFNWLNKIITTNTRQVFELLFSKLDRNISSAILSQFLSSEITISTVDELTKRVSMINEFNLPTCQILLSVLVASKEELESFVNHVLHHLNINFSPYNSYFGELFVYLPLEYKVTVLNTLQNIFFHSKFTDSTITLKFRGDNLLPPLSDFFHKASNFSSLNIDSDILINLTSFQEQLIQLLNKPTLTDTLDISTAITVYMRILIIHKDSICNTLVDNTAVQTSTVFIKQLLDLSTMKFFNEHEKLKVLLYDLLLSMKTTVKSALSDESEVRISENSSFELEDNFKLETMNRPSLQMLFDLPKPLKDNNPFKQFQNNDSIQCSIMLDEQELNCGGDYSMFNESGLVLKYSKSNTLNESFNNILHGSKSIQTKNSSSNNNRFFKMKSFQILEDSTHSLNDGCLSLHLFDAYTTKENLP